MAAYLQGSYNAILYVSASIIHISPGNIMEILIDCRQGNRYYMYWIKGSVVDPLFIICCEI